MPGNGKNAEEWSSKDKFGVVLETAGLNQAELAEYCRRKGLFIEQIAAWRAACQDANAHTADRNREQREQSKGDRKRIMQLEKELLRKDKALAEAAALIILRKKAQAIWGGLGRLVGSPDRLLAMTLIEDAVGSGCRRAVACETLEISLRTYQRWTSEGGSGIADGRKDARRVAPANKPSEEERARILVLVNSAEFASQPPSQIVPTLVDRGDMSSPNRPFIES